jgi:DNA polymerase (family 10)
LLQENDNRDPAPPSDPPAVADLTYQSQADLVRQCDIRGVLHTHTRRDDGAHTLNDMVQTAREIGLDYIGVSDHLFCGDHGHGLCPEGAARQRVEIANLREAYPGFDILHGAEIDADEDGNLPVDSGWLREFDYVIVTFANCADLDPEVQTARALKVIRNPLTRILGKPVGDYMLRQPPLPIDMGRVLEEAARHNVAVEIDANPRAPVLDWRWCHRAQELGVMLVINPNAHRAARLVDYRHGVEMVRDAGICCRSILNTLPSQDLRTHFLRGF